MKTRRSELLLAIDAGGTSTRAVLLDRTGVCLGYGTGPSGNPTASGEAAAAGAIVAAASSAVAAAGVDPGDVASSSVAMAGASGRPAAWLAAATGAAGLPAEVRIQADLVAVYLSGTLEPDGYAMVAGTGSIAARLRGSTIEAVCDGLGWLLGDAGSGFWIGRRVIRAATGDLDARDAPTALTGLLLAELGVPAGADRDAATRPRSLAAVLAEVYRGRPADAARFAVLAFTAAADGDAVATAILADAADELARTLGAVAAPGLRGPLVLGGSVLARQPGMVAAVRAALDDRIDGPVLTVDDGAVGAAVLALRGAGASVDAAVADRIRSTLATLRG